MGASPRPAPGNAAAGAGSRCSRPRWSGPGALERLAATLEELAGLIEGAGGTELNRVKTHVPATRLVRFNLGDALEIQVAHVARHLDQARRVREDPAFPRPA